ncbi:AfsR/SARP family transcriptional regulator [Streptomyces piniterrae]|uniref:AfsR/SARP family transcriptional regulator n=1 Tax=Streptomyces piniterrae TaxID=2571125 RepID=UPI00145E0B35|nr:BTAD domain-containing putative transcriptional regulator [Streptomyces piniterrae]
MFFRILGSLEACVDDEPLPLRRNRQLTILALLLVNANKATSIERLVEAVWHGHPPRTAAAQIQTCVWSLRKTLVAAGAHSGLIETKPSGYTLHLDGEQIDTMVFDRLVRQARATAGHDAALAVSLYRQALRIFRGPVLPEINSPAVQAAAAQWEERRLTVLEDCIEGELKVGVHGELVAELTALVEEQPLRERFCGQLMTALYGDDRRAEALAAYRTTRQALVHQLGLEPGPRLQQLHHKILTGTLLIPTAATAPVNLATVPAQLPAQPADFVGREALIARAVCVLTADGDGPEQHPPGAPQGAVRSCQFTGKCGAGKTALALRVAHQVRDRYPDGQLYADLAGSRAEPADTAEVLRGFLHALGVPDAQIPDGTSQRAALYRSVLARRRVLVLLDDAASSEQIHHLLPGGPHAAVVLTGRAGLTDLPGCSPIETDVLPEDDAVALFTTIVGSARAQEAPGAVHRIVALTGRLPLALRAAGARLAARPHLSLARFAEQLQDPELRLDQLTQGGLDLRERLTPSIRALPSDARTLWFVLSLLPTPDFPASVAAAVQGVPRPLAERLLDEMVDRGLLDIVAVDHLGAVRYRFLELIALCARELFESELPEPQRSALFTRVAGPQPNRPLSLALPGPCRPALPGPAAPAGAFSAAAP